MRQRAKVDANQKDVVTELRQMGVSVLHLHMVGMGCPDIACGWRGANYLFELKDPDKPPSARRLTDMEEKWHITWNGQVNVIHSAEEAMEIMQSRDAVNIEHRGVIR